MKNNCLLNISWLVSIFLIFNLCSCGMEKTAEANAPLELLNQPEVFPLERSFVLKEGTGSALNTLIQDKKGDIYAAGYADYHLVIFKLDRKLKSIKEMVRFGSQHTPKQDKITDMAMDKNGNIFVTGYTSSRDFPVTTGAYNTSIGEYDSQAILVKFSPDLELMASTFVGGESYDQAHAIAIDKKDRILIAGYSEGVDTDYRKNLLLPGSAFDAKAAPDDQAKAFVVRLNNTLDSLFSGTFLGGDYPQHNSDDEIYDMAIDSDGHIWVTGQTNSYDFPVSKSGIKPYYSGKGDGFVSKFTSDLSQLLASTYLGGRNQELVTSMVIDKKGNVFLGGWTESPRFPMVKGGFDTRYSNEEEDAFIVKVSSDLKTLIASTYLGGNYNASGYGDDFLSAMALSANGKILSVTGRSESENFPVTDKCYKSFTNDSDNPFGASSHRNSRKPREESSTDEDYGDGFIALFDTDLKTLHYATYLGGDNLEYTDDILWDDQELLVTGMTYSHEFPRITQKEKDPWSKGFVIRFNWKKNR